MSNFNISTNIVNNNPYINKIKKFTPPKIALGISKDEFIKSASGASSAAKVEKVEEKNLSDEEIQAKLKEGVALYKNGDYQGCIDALTIVTDNSKTPIAQAFHCKASAHRVLRNYNKALQDYTTALELAPNSSNTMKLRGRTNYLKAANENLQGAAFIQATTNAIKDFDNALAIKKEPDTYRFKAETLMLQGKYEEAAETFKDGIEVAEEHFQELKKEKGENDEKSYLNGMLGDMHHIKGNCHKLSGDKEAAYTEYSRALDYVPNSFATYKARAEVSYLQAAKDNLTGEDFKIAIESAIIDCDKAFDLNPEADPEPLKLKAKTYMLQGSYLDAIDCYNDAIALGEAKMDELNAKGADAKEIKETEINLADMHHMKATCLGLAGESKEILQKASEEYEKALELCPTSFNTASALGKTNYLLATKSKSSAGERSQFLDKSIEAYKKALELNRDNNQIHKLMASAFMAKSDANKAIESLNFSIKEETEQLEEMKKNENCNNKTFKNLAFSIGNSHHLKGNCLCHKGEFDEAIEEYKTALEFVPTSPNTYKALGQAELQKARKTVSQTNKKGVLVSAQNNFAKGISMRPEEEMFDGKLEAEIALKDYENATKTLQDAIDFEIRVNSGKNKARMGWLYAQKGDCIASTAKNIYSKAWQKAVNTYTKALEFLPNSDKIYYARACANSNFDYNAAKNDIKTAIDLNPERYEYWNFLSKLTSYSDNKEEREESFNALATAISLKNSDVQTINDVNGTDTNYTKYADIVDIQIEADKNIT